MHTESFGTFLNEGTQKKYFIQLKQSYFKHKTNLILNIKHNEMENSNCLRTITLLVY